jgi:MraZ protein
MFIGEYQHSLDEKGRVAVPAKFRLALQKGVVVTRGLTDKCLFVYPVDEWEKLAAKISGTSIAKANSLAFARLMLAGAMDSGLDSQGRVLLPDYLRKYAELKKDVVIAGLYNRLEVWDKEAWEMYRANAEQNSNEIAEKLGELGF